MSQNDLQPITVGFVALGCPKNVVDSERMLAEIAQAGCLITNQHENADVVVINTCGFIEPARAEALEEIRRAVSLKSTGRVRKVIVAGCLPQRLGAELFGQAAGIDAIAGLGQRDAITHIIKETLASDTPAAYLDHPCRAVSKSEPGAICTPPQTKNASQYRKGRQSLIGDRTRLLITPPHWAYLRISEGCDHRCSFCTIPAIRGRFRSKPQELVLAEAAELVSAGVVELNIIAQDTTYYGRDLKKKSALSCLLQELEKTVGLAWIRLMYSYPASIDDRLIRTIADSDKIVPYIDMPIQHINNKILEQMHRPDTKERICSLIEKLRSAIPDIVLRTTLIAGLPGETDRQFGELLEFVKWAQFDALGAFQFYPESGTPAAEMPDQIPQGLKQQRLEKLMLTQQEIAFAKNKERIGSILTCLVDSLDAGGTAKARFYGQAPNIDSICIINNCAATPGSFIDAKVASTKDYDLLLEQTGH